MTLLNEVSERDEIQPGVFRHSQHLKKIAYHQNGSLLAMSQDWENSGDVDRPHKVDRAPIMVSAGEDGMRRIHPTRELDRYVEIGAPFIKTGGVWGKVNLGAPTRTGSRLQWTRPQANMYMDFGGHFVKLAILLKGGFVPEDNEIAFPVGLTGFTRSAGRLLRDGTPIAFLNAPVMMDFANEQDIRPIAGQFVNINSQPYWHMTLPSLTGMSQPVIDPTLTLQPDATAGKDTWLASNAATFNFGVNARLVIGLEAAGPTRTSLIRFDVSSIPSSASITSAVLTYNVATSFGTQNLVFYRVLVDWDEGALNNAAGTASWNQRIAATNWNTAGCRGSGTDRAASSTATAVNPAVGVGNIDLTPDVVLWVAGSATNFGWQIDYSSVVVNNLKNLYSSDDATASLRPQLDVIYTVPSGITKHFMNYQRMRQT